MHEEGWATWMQRHVGLLVWWNVATGLGGILVGTSMRFAPTLVTVLVATAVAAPFVVRARRGLPEPVTGTWWYVLSALAVVLNALLVLVALLVVRRLLVV